MPESKNGKRRPFADQDEKGHYGIDGVSYDGEDVIVGGDQSNEKEINPNDSTKATKLDRQKNLDWEEATSTN